MGSVKISVVSPVYGAKESLPHLYRRLVDVLSSLTDDFEIILVNDACPQNSWDTIVELGKADGRVKGINLSRNFGQHYAITAGLDHVRGDWIVVMDCDLQDQPEEIPKLYEKAQEGFDIVIGQRLARNDSPLKKLYSKLFGKVFTWLSGIERDSSQANFGIFSREVIQSVNRYREQNRAFFHFVNIVGFKKAAIPVAHASRYEGKSSYDFAKGLRLALDTVLAHSNKPLKLSIQLGFLLSFFSMCYGLWLVVRYFFYSITVEGWTSMMVVMLFMFGILFSLLGIIGLYIGKIFDETKGRPLYIVAETMNLGDESTAKLPSR